MKARFPDRNGGMLPAGTHATEADAHAALNALVEQAAEGLTPNGGVILETYGLEGIEAWPDRANTKKGCRSVWKNFCSQLASFKDPIDFMTTTELKEFCFAKSTKSVISPKTEEPYG
jgi:hypothetical protein